MGKQTRFEVLGCQRRERFFDSDVHGLTGLSRYRFLTLSLVISSCYLVGSNLRPLVRNQDVLPLDQLGDGCWLHIKKKDVHKTTTTDDKRLQSTLKRIGVNAIPAIEEVNIFKDETVIQFLNPKVQASVAANTWVVSGSPQIKNDDCAKELAGVPGVISVGPDENLNSDNKEYGGQHSSGDSSIATQPANIKTKKLFVTGLSFYTSEKTLRAAFEGFGELVEVKIIMDKISKRSKGFAFIEYTTEEAASEALREMNGKIINGWMIVVDVAKTNPPKYSKERPRPAS